MRRRIYLMRHAEVAYFEPDGRPLPPEAVPLTSEGEKQAQATRDALAGVDFDRCVTSGLERTLATARIVAPGLEPEVWADFRELEGGRLDEIPDEDLEQAFTGVFRASWPRRRASWADETIGALFDRVLPTLERLLADESWDVLLAVLHGGVNRAILSYALTGQREFLGNFEQAPACVNVLDAAPRTGSCARSTSRPTTSRTRPGEARRWSSSTESTCPTERRPSGADASRPR